MLCHQQGSPAAASKALTEPAASLGMEVLLSSAQVARLHEGMQVAPLLFHRNSMWSSCQSCWFPKVQPQNIGAPTYAPVGITGGDCSPTCQDYQAILRIYKRNLCICVSGISLQSKFVSPEIGSVLKSCLIFRPLPCIRKSSH